MPRLFLVAAFVLAFVSTQAQTPTFNLTLTSANGGAGTLFSWSYTGEISYTRTANGTAAESLYIPMYGAENDFTTATSPGAQAFAGLDASFNFVVSGSTGLVMTSTTDGAFTQLIDIRGIASIGFIYFGINSANLVYQTQGETVTLSGPSSGSLLSEINFSNFNAGQWTYEQAQFPDYTYNTVLTVGGTPIPEPSTYGLILGGLALAGAAVRRRRAKRG